MTGVAIATAFGCAPSFAPSVSTIPPAAAETLRPRSTPGGDAGHEGAGQSANSQRDVTTPAVRAIGPSADDTLLVEVRLEGVGARMAKVVRQGDDVYLPADVVTELIGRADPVLVGESMISITRLRTALGTAISFDGAELVVTIVPTPGMPNVLRRTRERERAGARAASGAAGRSPSPPVALAGGNGVLALDYNVFGSSSRASRPDYDGRAVLAIAGGDLSAAFSSGIATPDVAWTLLRPGTRFVSRLQVGTAYSGTALQFRRIQGISFGNTPPNRPFIVDLRAFSGRLPAGWTVDAYQAGRFFAFDSIGSDGRYALTLPMGYGQNVVDLVAYGPQGERIALQEYVRYAPGLLGRGRSEYEASLGRCVDQSCKAAGHVSTRFGLLSGLTVEGGLRYERNLEDDNRLSPFGSLVALFGNALGFEAEGRRGAVRRLSGRYEPSPLSGIEAVWLDAEPESAWTSSSIAPRSLRLDAWAALHPRSGAATLRAQWRYTPDSVAPRHEITLGTSHLVAGVQVRPYTVSSLVRSGAPAAHSGAEILMPAVARWPSWLQGAWARTLVEVDHEGGRVRRTEFTVSRQVTREFRLETEARWRREQRGPSLAVRMVTHSGTVRGTARAQQAPGAAGSSWDYAMGGSVIADPRAGRVMLSSEPSFDRAGVSVRAFLDVNADGVRQEGEPPVVGAGIAIGSRVVVTDGHGRAVLWGVPAFEPVFVRVDSATVPPQWHVPAPVIATLRGARTTQLDLAFTPGTTLEGQLVTDGIEPGRVSVTLLDHQSQRETSLELFGDGSFYVMSLRPGSYTLSASLKGDSTERLGRLRIDIQPIDPTVSNPIDPRVSRVTLILTAPLQRPPNRR